MKYYNGHAHTFNMRDVPDQFLRVKVGERFANIAHWFLQQPVLSDAVLWIAKKLITRGTSAKTVAFLMIGVKKTQDMVFEDLLSNYPTGDEVKCIILPIDFTYMGAGPLQISYEQQLEELFDVKLKYPNCCFPFVAIDPRRGNAEENRDFVKTYIDRGFSGIKLYPALGYFGFDAGLKDVYAYAQEKQIPIMTHCSSGGINYVGKIAPPDFIRPKVFGPLPDRTYVFPQNDQKIEDYCDQFNDPANFLEVLTMYPDLKICFAHLGLNSKTKLVPSPWMNSILNLMQEFPNVYADISYSVAYKGFCPWFLKLYQSWPPEIQDRVLFGTDYFMTVQEVYGNDREILETVLKGFPLDLFKKLANENVARYLKTK